MGPASRVLAGLALALGLGCLPLVSHQEIPGGLEASALVYRTAERTFIALTVPKAAGEAGWEARFEGDAPPDFSSEDLRDATILRWSVNTDTLKRKGTLAYQVPLRRGEQSCLVVVHARRQSPDDVGGFMLLDLAVHLAARR